MMSKKWDLVQFLHLEHVFVIHMLLISDLIKEIGSVTSLPLRNIMSGVLLPIVQMYYTQGPRARSSWPSYLIWPLRTYNINYVLTVQGYTIQTPIQRIPYSSLKGIFFFFKDSL